MKQRTKDNGSHNDDWATPQYILDWVRREYGEFFDPCPLNAKFDGLSIPWKKVNFVNPPYNNKAKSKFIGKAIIEASHGKVCVCLIPANTETYLFKQIWLYADRILFIQGRVKFKGINTKGEYVTNKTGQTGSMIVVFIPKRNNSYPVVDIIFKEAFIGPYTLENNYQWRTCK